jgi:6-phosphogluconate dehydrogenase
LSSDIGIVGLGTMGANLALNLNSKGFSVAVFNRTTSVLNDFLTSNKREGLGGSANISEFCSMLSKPRVIMLMVTAGSAVDSVIQSLLPYLSKDDIIIDGGNSYFKDTQRRYTMLKERGIRFAGVGISGGELGALKGPSIMAGCDEDVWDKIGIFFKKIAAKDFEGKACAARLGKDGAGHFVKTVHNGIEYVILELIAEAYMLLASSGMDNDAISGFFSDINKDYLDSYLLEIASKVLRKREDHKYLVDLILDYAEQKGTGLWAAQSAFELGVPAYSIAIAPLVRLMSTIIEERKEASLKFGRKKTSVKVNKNSLRSALLSSEIAAYSEGFSLIAAASKAYNWDTDLAEVARVWQGGCIIRSELLKPIRNALKKSPSRNIMLDEHISSLAAENLQSLRDIVSLASSNSLPIPAFSTVLQYMETYSSERLPTNLVQAMRDYFGAHGYRRIDREGHFHTDWES